MNHSRLPGTETILLAEIDFAGLARMYRECDGLCIAYLRHGMSSVGAQCMYNEGVE